MYVIKIKDDRLVTDHIKSYRIKNNHLEIDMDGYSFMYLSSEVDIKKIATDLDNYFRIVSENRNLPSSS